MSAASAIGLAVGAAAVVMTDSPDLDLALAPTRLGPPIGASRPRPPVAMARADAMTAHPLLTGVISRPAPIVALQGTTLAPKARALLTVGAKPAQWLSVGESADGVELIEVGAGSVVVDTSEGFKTLTLATAAAQPSTSPVPLLAKPVRPTVRGGLGAAP